MDEGERLLTVEEVGARLGLAVLTVRRYLREGRLPGIRYGRLWRVRERDLDEYVRGLSQAAGADRAARQRKAKAAGAPIAPKTAKTKATKPTEGGSR